jgi:hypothetical protein
MKRILLYPTAILLSHLSFAQSITISYLDMPVADDTFRYSISDPSSTIVDVTDTGTNVTWAYDSLKSIAQVLDTCKLALNVDTSFKFTSTHAYGYKTADSIPGLDSLGDSTSIGNVYTFFYIGGVTSSYDKRGLGATLRTASGSVRVSANYSMTDHIYYFPIKYGSFGYVSSFAVALPLPGIGSLKMYGTRHTYQDGYGTITTPYYTTATNCLRVRADIHETDTLYIAATSTNVPIEMDTIEYQWLVNGGIYPALYVIQSKSTGEFTSITYADSNRTKPSTSMTAQPVLNFLKIKAHPNPTPDGFVQIDVPPSWKNFEIYVYSANGVMVHKQSNQRRLDLSSFAAGQYSFVVYSKGNIGYSKIVK